MVSLGNRTRMNVCETSTFIARSTIERDNAFLIFSYTRSVLRWHFWAFRLVRQLGIEICSLVGEPLLGA